MYLSLLDFSLLWLRLRERLLLGDLDRDFDFFSYDPERLLKVKVKNIIRKKLAFYYYPSTNHLSPKVIHACERAWYITNPRIWTNPILNPLQGMPSKTRLLYSLKQSYRPIHPLLPNICFVLENVAYPSDNYKQTDMLARQVVTLALGY